MTKKNSIISLAVNDKPETKTTKEKGKFLELRVLEAGPSAEITEFDAGTEALMQHIELYSPCVDCPEVAKADYNTPQKNYKRCKDCEYNQ
jgi:hypothetical protein